ncbi:regulatory protein RecX [Candidatus Protochlamydia phocaeensis]|uniref:regulatory protein RecX n=1 Tax=Candidatus Protochlamydia phocaeensis TaxID=1414722 RepID=UPI00083941F5|nr:regulatory protein RecX [Candidatus Protochlamydia phocaeensis]
MKIECKPKAERKEILTVFLDGEPWRDVHIAIFGRFPAFPTCLSIQEWTAAFELLEYKRVKNYVIRRLAAQSYHSEQLNKLLRERLVQPPTIQKIIQECQEWGYLNDEAWIENFVRAHQKKQGLRVILAKLQAKGLSTENLQHIREQWINPEEETLAIRRLIQTKYRSKDLSQYKEKQKVFAALMRKGYPFELIQAVLYSCDQSES